MRPRGLPRKSELEKVYETLFGRSANPGESIIDSAPAPPEGAIPHEHSFAHSGVDVDDEQIVHKAARSRSATKFQALWAGYWQGTFSSQSEADSSLVFLLAFYTKDAGQIDRLFRRSGLMSPQVG